MNIFYSIPVIIFAYFVIVETQETINSDDIYDIPEPNNNTEFELRAFCYRFTWLGPKFNNESEFKNATCDDILKGSEHVPCVQPLIVSDNGYLPNTTWVWDHYKYNPASVACRLVRGEVCAKISYMYNGAYENITYLCTKANMEGEGAISSGCFSEDNNGRVVEVCLCSSTAGKYPCNLSNKISSINLLLTILTGFMILNYSL